MNRVELLSIVAAIMNVGGGTFTDAIRNAAELIDEAEARVSDEQDEELRAHDAEVTRSVEAHRELIERIERKKEKDRHA